MYCIVLFYVYIKILTTGGLSAAYIHAYEHFVFKNGKGFLTVGIQTLYPTSYLDLPSAFGLYTYITYTYIPGVR